VKVLLLELRLAWFSLVEHRRRSALLGAAIAAVAALFVLLTSLAAGINQTLFESALTLASGHINVGGFYKVSPGQAFPLLTGYEKVAELAGRLPEVESVVQRGRGFGKLVAETAATDAALVGVDVATEPRLSQQLVVVQGNLAELRQPRTLLLFEGQAKNLKVGVGDAITVVSQTARGVSNTMDCRVGAIAKDLGMLSSFTALTSVESLRELLQLRPDVTGVLQIRIKERYLNDLPRITDDLRATLTGAGYPILASDPGAFFEKLESVARSGWTGQKLDISTWEEEISFLKPSFVALQALSSLLITVLLGVTIAGVMNSLWIATRERTREIGTLRAIGMQRGAVARMFLLEAAQLGLLASTFGVALGSGAVAWLNHAGLHVPLSMQLFLMRDTLRLSLEPKTLLLALALLTLSAALAALYPSLRAARLRPMSAMTHLS